ncbi:response regulator transcription factor [Oligoflexus tunisiensis]|uniref:response regulator transcription factor n=1 Tax=Oligoflexus tunisiensis TaxID=708132 RepID=UPI00114CA184|nr:response regulator [Oligoflexus tunisiensis]
MEQHDRQRYTITLDDDPTIRLIIEHATGMTSLPFVSVETLLARADHYAPVALFVDIHLGVKGWGLDAIPILRTKWSCPIIVITADAASQLIAQALALGAHDFIRKPIQEPELQARLRARIAEMTERVQESVRPIGDVVYTSKRRLLERGDRKQFLPPYEAQIFEALVAAQGIIMTKDELRCKVWGDIKVSDSALDKKIFTIRKVLRDLGSQIKIQSKYGKGLSLIVPRTGSRTSKVEAA